jgi:DNA polymerase I-like protein with 3'-5' exonuclease and polymerase domains
MIYLDIETNTSHDTIWLCVTMKDGVVTHWRNPEGLLEYLGDDKVCGHNIIGFDAPVLSKVWGIVIHPYNLVDTLALSRLYKPDIEMVSIEGQKAPSLHSLEAWGIRLGEHKISFTDFDAGWSEDMAQYCEQDVLLLRRLHNHLTKVMVDEGFSDKSIELEHEVAVICKRMEDTGFMLDERKAMLLQAELSGRMADIEAQMQEVFKPIVEQRWSDKTGKQLKDKTTIFNPGSRQQIAERLQGLGVVFKKKTEKGHIIVDETVLEGIDLPEAKLVSEYLMLQKRVAQVSSWLELVQPDGRVHGRVITNGAVTGRCTHSSPNMAQVPAVGNPYGAECREMWTVPKGKVQVGVDLSGIELRCLAHYMRDLEWQEELLKGDIHWKNCQAFGLVPKGTIKDDGNSEHKKFRNQTKTMTYSMLYGAGGAKVGLTAGVSASKGKQLIENFLDNTPALKKLKNKISKIGANGKLPGLDGRILWIRSQHAALNTLLQCAGAVVAKQWLVESTKALNEANIDAKLIAFVHDETQWEVDVSQAQQAVDIIEKAATKAGEVLQFRCPVAAEGKIGNNWQQTH